MTGQFMYDLFLSYSSKDKKVVRLLAQRLRKDRLKVWFDEWEIKPGDSIQSKIEEGLENSRLLILCMSSNAFGSDWSKLESYTFRFRDPLNKDRRFIPIRLDDTPIKGSLSQFQYINWHSSDREKEYSKLLAVCRGDNSNISYNEMSEVCLENIDSIGPPINDLKYYIYLSTSKVNMLYGQIAGIDQKNVLDNKSNLYSKLCAVISKIHKERGVMTLPRNNSNIQTGYFEDTDKWNMAVLDNSDSRFFQNIGTAFCIYKDQGNIITVLLGSPKNMTGNQINKFPHSISPSWSTTDYLLTLVRSWENNINFKTKQMTLEKDIDKVLYFCGNVCAYMQRTSINVMFRALYVYEIDPAIWEDLFTNKPDSIFVGKAEYLIIGSPIYVALSENNFINPDSKNNHYAV